MTASEKSVRTAKFPARYESLTPLRESARNAAVDAGLNEKAVYAVQMAVDEAFTNIIEHAFGGERDEEVECRFSVSRDALTVTLKDCGVSFNPDEIQDPDLEAPLEEREVGGLGLFFMRQLMDEVKFTFHPGEGERGGCNILEMVKRKENAG